MSCNQNCDQGRTCNCRTTTDRTEIVLLIVFVCALIGFMTWSLI